MTWTDHIDWLEKQRREIERRRGTDWPVEFWNEYDKIFDGSEETLETARALERLLAKYTISVP